MAEAPCLLGEHVDEVLPDGLALRLGLVEALQRVVEAALGVYDRVVEPDLLIRRVNLAAVELVREDELPQEAPEQLSLFADCGELEARRARERADDEKERRLQKATLRLQQKYGRNAVLKGMNLLEGGTTIERNRQIGGHRSGEEDRT